MKRSLILIASLTTALALAGCDQSDDDTQTGSAGDQSATDEASQPESTATDEVMTEEDAAEAEATAEDEAMTEEEASTMESATLDDAEEDGATEEAELETLEGSVTYHERIALPDDAELSVQLLDVSLADAAAKALGEVAFVPGQQVPIDFAIEYDANTVASDGRYALHAEIHTADGELLWTTADHHEVELGDDATNEPVELVLQQAAVDADPLGELVDEAESAIEGATQAAGEEASKAIEGASDALKDATGVGDET